MKGFWLFLLLAGMVLLMAPGCSCDDDDDDDDNNDNNDNDDDNDADDDAADDDAGGDCDGYDLTVSGTTHFDSGDQSWVASLNIDIGSGAITGMVDPEGDSLEPYAVTGTRFDQTTGEMEGSFDRPATIPDAICDEDTVANHIDFTVLEGIFSGDITFYCGTIAEENLIMVVETDGAVACGDFAM